MNYYERYWKKRLGEEGSLNAPPEWAKEDLADKINLFKPYFGKRVLDVGCGEGVFTNEISKITNVVGVECSSSAIELGREKFLNLDIRHGDILNLPFSNGEFDCVTAIEVVEHILDTELMFKMFNRVLKPNGFLCITTTEMTVLKNLIISLFFFEKYYYPTNPHIRYYTRNTLKDILEKTGFRVKKYRKNGSYLGFIPMGQAIIAQKVNDILK